jgi:hypothetical protein
MAYAGQIGSAWSSAVAALLLLHHSGVVDDLEEGIATTADYTVKEAVTDFLDQGMKGKAQTTIDNYRSMADSHLIPQIGAAKLKKLTADELDRWMDERAKELSTRSLRLIHQILERAIRHA